MDNDNQNRTKVDMFFERWNPNHQQIIAIALVYAHNQVQSVDWSPLSPALPSSPIPPTNDLDELDDEDNQHPSSAEEDPDQFDYDKLASEDDESFVQVSQDDTQSSENSNNNQKNPISYLFSEQEDTIHYQWLEDRKLFSQAWLQFILDAFKIDRDSLPERPQLENILVLAKQLPQSVHLEIIHDLVLLSLSASHSNDKPRSTDSQRSSSGPSLGYSALDRQLIFLVGQALNIDPALIYGTEKLVAQQLFFIIQRTQQENSSSTAQPCPHDLKLASTSKTALDTVTAKKNWLRYLGAGAGLVVGGVAIGLTGGLAAPVLGSFLVGITGGAFGFMATSGGAILLGTMFGLAGGGLAGYRAQRRLKGISEFTFERLPDQIGEDDNDLPRIPSLHATILAPGFLLAPTDYKDPWIPTFCKTIDRRDVYVLKAETGGLLSTGRSLETYVRDTLLQHGATEIIRHTLLASVCTALLLPASIYGAAVLALDNDYQRARDICQKAGILLADMIEQEGHGARPLTLIGSGMGSITIFRALLELSRRPGWQKNSTIVDQAIMICSPLAPTQQEWRLARRMVSRRLVNVYSKNDWVLAILARMDSLLSARMPSQVAGLIDLRLPYVLSVDVSDLVHGHLELNSKLPQILDRVGINS